jgi:hypothetical protein
MKLSNAYQNADALRAVKQNINLELLGQFAVPAAGAIVADDSRPQ